MKPYPFVGLNHLTVPVATARSIGCCPGRIAWVSNSSIASELCQKLRSRSGARHEPKADIGGRRPPDAAMQLTTLRAYGFFCRRIWDLISARASLCVISHSPPGRNLLL